MVTIQELRQKKNARDAALEQLFKFGSDGLFVNGLTRDGDVSESDLAEMCRCGLIKQHPVFQRFCLTLAGMEAIGVDPAAVKRYRRCRHCNGSGSRFIDDDLEDEEMCADCDGEGWIEIWYDLALPSADDADDVYADDD